MIIKLYLHHLVFYFCINNICFVFNLFELCSKIKFIIYIIISILYFYFIIIYILNFFLKLNFFLFFMNFKEPVSTFAYNLISLHHDIMWYVILILSLVY
jgi:hypothetical protein